MRHPFIANQGHRLLSDQEGAVLAEFAIWLPLMFVGIFFLMFCYSGVKKETDLQVATYVALRQEIQNVSDRGDLVQRVQAEERDRMEVPHILSSTFGLHSQELTISMSGWAGAGKGKYRNRYVGPYERRLSGP